MNRFSLVVALLFASSLIGCGVDETIDDTTTVGTELVAGTTSVCVKLADGRTIRADGVGVASGADSNTLDATLVPAGATETPLRGAQLAFVEAGGTYTATSGSGSLTILLASGANATLSGGGGHVVYASGASTLTCGVVNRSVSINSESTATLLNCAGQGTQQLVAKTPTFTRCAATTPATLVYPKLGIAIVPTPSGLTVNNTSTGNYTGLQWALKVTHLGVPKTTTTVMTSASVAGFALPPNFNTLYPSMGYRRFVTLTLTSPLGNVMSTNQFF